MSTASIEWFVSPEGDDRWSGRLAAPSADGTDGPFRTLARARDAARNRIDSAQTTTIWLREGRYALAQPLTLGPEDSNCTIAAYAEELPIIDAGRRIEGWRIEQVHGRACWVADLPEVEAGHWYFDQLFVAGGRRPRARLPKQGMYRMANVPTARFSANALDGHFEGTDTFQVEAGHIQQWHNLSDVEVVAVHFWIEERLPIATFDAQTNTVRSSRRSMLMLRDDIAARWAAYYVENVFEALLEAGEWYLDRSTGTLYYLPQPGEDPTTTPVFAPFATGWLHLIGDPDEGSFVEHVQLRGLHFAHAATAARKPVLHYFSHNDDAIPDDPELEFAAAPQAAVNVPGALVFVGARNCSVEGCTIGHCGGYAIELGDGCSDIAIVGNHIFDLGAGGIHLSGSDVHGARARRTGNNHITDNHIHDGGRIFHSAIGILARHTAGNTIAYNHIHDFFYSGISCGWFWGYGEQVARDNLIAYNHIHDLGKGLLSDMGGIYTLGVQPGTVLRGNRLHDITAANYGGWAIYCDEGSSHLVIEDNICFNTSSQCFHQHYGRENVLRNNIFAFAREALVGLSRAEPHVSCTLERNILISHGEPAIAGGRERLEKGGFISDLNILWDVAGAAPYAANISHDDEAQLVIAHSFDLERWRAQGHDRHSVVADPCCRNLQAHDFALTTQSPAYLLGFRPTDSVAVGPRERQTQ
jgi:hypothetical protein